MRTIYPLNDGWGFTEQYSPALLTTAGLEGLTPVRLPHTVKILPYNHFSQMDYQMLSGYARVLHAPEDWQGKYVALTFFGAAHRATVYLNGQQMADHNTGYTAFTVDLSDKLRWGQDNLLTVALDSRDSLDTPPFGKVVDYMTFGGIYREVELEVADQRRIADVFVQADMDGALTCEFSVQHAGGLTLEAAVLDEDGTVLAQAAAPAQTGTISMQVPHVRPWRVDDPALYRLRVRLLERGAAVDETLVRFGFRRVEFRADGFYLNGEKIKLRGLDRHQSYPYLGYAAPARAQKRDADILKYELGCNAVRTSHYPQSHHFIDRCDEIGLLVFTEFPGWQHIGGAAWKRQAVENVREMVLQYRNHPSIFLWGVRINESPDDDAFYAATNQAAHALDPTRPTSGVRCIKYSHLLEDVYAYNEFIHTGDNQGCEPKRAVTSDMSKGYFISEHNGHMYPTKPFDDEPHRLSQALRHARVLNDMMAQEDIGGSFGWCMFDYNTTRDFGSGDRICYHGVMDMFRNPKLAAAVYASQSDSRPVLTVSSTMDIGEHPGGAVGEIAVFTNADAVRLYRNDELVGTFPPSAQYPAMLHPPVLLEDTVGQLMERHEGFSREVSESVKTVLRGISKHGQWGLPQEILDQEARLQREQGISHDEIIRLYNTYMASWGGHSVSWRFEAVRDGAVVRACTLAPAETVHLEADCDSLALTDGPTWDMASIRIRAVGEQGNVLPYCTRAVCLEVQGAIELIGPKAVPLCGGMTGCYVRTTGQSGDGALIISADGAEPLTLCFSVTKA